jgi:hypothetical protein
MNRDAAILAVLFWLLWRRTSSEVLIDYGEGGGFQPPIMEPHPVIPDPWEESQRLIPGETPIYKNPPWAGVWWEGL